MTPTKAIVTQADRDAAAVLLRALEQPFYADEAASGEVDSSAAAQAFARHRLNASGLDEAIEALSRITDCYGVGWKDAAKFVEAVHPFMMEGLDALARLPCQTKGAEDLEPGCCAPCRARAILTELRGE